MSLNSLIHSIFPHIKIIFNITTRCWFTRRMFQILYSVCEYPSKILKPFTHSFIRAIFTTYLTLFDSITLIILYDRACGGVVVEAVRYKPAGRGFDSRWCHWNFSVTQSYRAHYGPGVESASNRNKYQVYFLGVKVTVG